MNGRAKNMTVTAEDLRQLQAEFFDRLERRDERLYKKMDLDRNQNIIDHDAIKAKLACIDKTTSVKGAVLGLKLTGIVAGISLLVSGMGSAAFFRWFS